MKINLTILLLVFLKLATATNRYVSSANGSTSGTGTQGNPYKNLSQLSALMPGDTVLLECGSVFRETLSLFAGGNSSANLVITSYGSGALPIISGADTVKNWTQSGNKFFAAQSGSVKNFFANSKEQIIARTPDEGTYYELDSAQTTYLKDAGITQSNNYWNGAKVCVHSAQWCWEKTTVTTQINGKVNFATPLHLIAINRYGYFFYDKDSCLNADKEWYYDSLNSRIWYIPQGGQNANAVFCEASVRANGISLQNTASYITISNIRFEKQSGNGISFGNQSQNISVIGCQFFGQYNHGIQTKGKYHLISNCTFNEVDGHGLDINQGGNSEVRYCSFKNIGQFRNSGIGGETNLSAIAVNFTDSCYLHHNVIDSTGYCGISADGAYHVIERNMASHCMLLNNDGAPFKAFGNTSHHTVFRNNIAFATSGNTEGCFNPTFSTPGIYFDLLVNNCTIENNTIYNVPQKGVFLNCGTSDNRVYGNVAFGCDVGLDMNGSLQINDTLNRVSVFKNTLCAASQTQYCLRQVDSYTPNTFVQGTLDSNYYFQPYDTGHVVMRPGSGQASNSLSQWNAFSGQDAHTKNAFKNYSTAGFTPQLFVNSTENDSIFNLGNVQYLDLDSNIVCGSITVPAFYSKVLIATNNTCSIVSCNISIDTSNITLTPSCDGNSVGSANGIIVTGYTGFCTTQWFNSNGNLAQQGNANTWLNNVTGGLYWLKASDSNACVDSIQINIPSGNTPVFTVQIADSNLCYGESTIITASPNTYTYVFGSPYQFANDSATVSNAGIPPSNLNCVTGYDSAGCSVELCAPLHRAAVPSATPVITQNGNQLYVQPLFPNGTCEWFLNDTLIADSTNNSITISQSGTYTVHCLYFNGECYQQASLNVALTALDNTASDIRFSLYPNPANDRVYLICNDELLHEELSVFDVSGRKVITQNIADNFVEVDLNGLSAGTYFVQIKNEMMKFVKQ